MLHWSSSVASSGISNCILFNDGLKLRYKHREGRACKESMGLYSYITQLMHTPIAPGVYREDLEWAAGSWRRRNRKWKTGSGSSSKLRLSLKKLR